VAMADATITAGEVTMTVVAVITMAEVAIVNPLQISGALSAAFFMSGLQYSDRSANGCRPSHTL
jgi:hypothetical protein